MSSLPPVAKLAMGGLVAATGAVGFVLTSEDGLSNGWRDDGGA